MYLTLFLFLVPLSFHRVNIKSMSIDSIWPGIGISASPQPWRHGKTNALLNFTPDAEF